MDSDGSKINFKCSGSTCFSDEIVNLLMRHVKNKNDYNDQELTYITAVLRHVLNQLDKQDESYKEKFIQNVRFDRNLNDLRFRM